jgi:2-polyprenyl-3-methyl-5-hydroxy-6-metoxy-1,4-benzoquinol methylase
MNEEQEKYYQTEWTAIKLSESPGRSGWRTAVPAPDFIQFIEWLINNKIRGKALDLGCGGGRHSILLAKSGFETYGIDFAEAAIKTAAINADNANVSDSTHFQVGNVLDLPYGEDSFDIVNDDGCLHHINPEDWITYLQNINKVIKDGGILRIKTFSNNCDYFTQNTDNVRSQWIHLNDSGYTYFFSEADIRNLFLKNFEILSIEEKTHTQASDKKFFFVLLKSL